MPAPLTTARAELLKAQRPSGLPAIELLHSLVGEIGLAVTLGRRLIA